MVTKYRSHTVKCVVNIKGSNHIDYCVCCQGKKALIIVKYQKSCAIFDFKEIMNGRYKPLNSKCFDTTGEAYDKMMRWIGKMVKKSDKSRYYNNSTGKYHFFFTFEVSVLETLRNKKTLKKLYEKMENKNG